MMSFSEYVELVKTLHKREEGQTMAEYAVVLGVIVVATVAVFITLGTTIGSVITSVTGKI